jgi:hypothetical protein
MFINKENSDFVRFNATNEQSKNERPYELDPNYIVGVVFLFTVIGLLLYVNFFYNFSIKAAFIKIYYMPAFSFLKHCIIVHKNENIFESKKVVISEVNVDENDNERRELTASMSSVFIDYPHVKSNLDIL